MKNRIKYIIYYNSSCISGENRNYALSAINKANYVIKSLNEIGYQVDIISPNWANCGFKLIKSKKETVARINTVNYLPSISFPGKIGQFISYIISMLALFVYLTNNCSNEEHIIVYHTQAFAKPALYAKKIKKIHICLEVEEIYYKAFKLKFNHEKSELSILKHADSYIFVNHHIQREVNKANKPYAILYGAYDTKKYKNVKAVKSDRHKLVYAGMIDLIQSDAFNAVRLCENLSEMYSLSIAGNGNNESINRLKKIIKEHNRRFPCKVSFDGSYEGEEFDKYISAFDIGLNIRKCSEGYNFYSFPSKILMYLSHGLQVFTTPIECVVQSEIADSVTISSSDSKYDEMAYQLIELQDKDFAIDELDREFKQQLKAIC